MILQIAWPFRWPDLRDAWTSDALVFYTIISRCPGSIDFKSARRPDLRDVLGFLHTCLLLLIFGLVFLITLSSTVDGLSL
jgi:hypothetical protein